MSQSEVAQLRTKIEEELYAMQQGLSGLAAGTSKHQFLQAKMHRIGQIEDQLATHIGFDQATLICCQTYIQVMEEPRQPQQTSTTVPLSQEEFRKMASQARSPKKLEQKELASGAASSSKWDCSTRLCLQTAPKLKG